ncbi:MAG: ERAP1-like C-terminal domain-containing protein, partial [Verrucomicrobiota bacterium]|nr:ERAP1-like C-terminal domain-containing protein [Verrucomicrobiota bacterium]
RVAYDEASWKLLLGEFPKLKSADRVNLLADTWALVQADRAAFAQYLELVAKLPRGPELAEDEQVIGVFDYINRLIAGAPEREKFQAAARAVLRPIFDRLGWNPKTGEPPRPATLRADLIGALGNLGDQDVIKGCRERFAKFLSDREALAPDLRPAVLSVVGRYADEATWDKLHELGMKTTSIEEKQYFYDALADALDPALAQKTLQISLGKEVPTSRAVFLVSKVSRESERPDVAWDFAKAHMPELLAKTDALGANSYAPSLFTFFSDEGRIAELETFAKANLAPEAAKEVAKATDELGFRAELKKRLLPQLTAWTSTAAAR